MLVRVATVNDEVLGEIGAKVHEVSGQAAQGGVVIFYFGAPELTGTSPEGFVFERMFQMFESHEMRTRAIHANFIESQVFF